MTITQKYANHYGWSDINPYEVVRVVSDKSIDIREIDTEKDPSVKTTFELGGFSAVSDNVQAWFFKPNENNRVERIRLHKDGIWRNKNGNRFYLADRPIKFYDYNF